MATNLADSLKRGVASIGGQGVDPATLYGVPPSSSSPVGAWSPTGTGGAPSSPMVPGQTGSTVSAQAPNPMPTKMPWHGAVPGPTNAGSGVLAGVESTAPKTLGENTFGMHPDVTHEQLLNWILPRVKNVESQGDYKADRSTSHPGQSASGAYQYIDSTWNKYKGYNRAVDAPPEIQEQKAKEDFAARVSKFGGDPFKTVADHYFPRYAHDPSLWNQPLKDAHGREIAGAEPVSKYLSKVLPPERVQAYLQAQQQALAAQNTTGGGSTGVGM